MDETAFGLIESYDLLQIEKNLYAQVIRLWRMRLARVVAQKFEIEVSDLRDRVGVVFPNDASSNEFIEHLAKKCNQREADAKKAVLHVLASFGGNYKWNVSLVAKGPLTCII